MAPWSVIRTLLALSVVVAGLLAWAVQSGRVDVPAHWNPWAPLNVAEPPNWLTGYKLQRTAADPTLCSAVLAASNLKHTAVPDNATGDGCGWAAAVRVDDARFAPAFTLTCSAALSLAMWERHALQPAAQAHFSQPVARIDHFGSYACRNVRGAGGEGGRRSQHASANAFDVAGFRLGNGRRISLVNDWEGEAAEAAFLREVRDGACRFFKGTLGPDYNAAHRDHFHLDQGPYRICR
ncbi:MAG: extensin family protein [Hydrogenophaga sp.]|uniref:extensin-like domain-containing protein n=1 Tax=Hydrogenophaga sp. TaxID=1904254 RepID=UPI00271A335A|nr:extensin family protein [Hydrogenophaga sp.]MDO8887880.1 extensin family protein [Hydrogenophaga sp.]MDP2249769.1 extensin family protein [Hydrogenophaga sp.]